METRWGLKGFKACFVAMGDEEDKKPLSELIETEIETSQALTYADWYDVLGLPRMRERLYDLPSSDEPAEPVTASDQPTNVELLYGMGFAERTEYRDTPHYRRTEAGDKFAEIYETFEEKDAWDTYEAVKKLQKD